MRRLIATIATGDSATQAAQRDAMQWVLAYPLQSPPMTLERAIGFSLYGDNPKYCVGMVRNATIAPYVFPDWSVVVFHDDTVPPDVLQQLRQLSCSLVNCTGQRVSGMFWRLFISRMAKRWIQRDA